jgi:hypothetical protein
MQIRMFELLVNDRSYEELAALSQYFLARNEIACALRCMYPCPLSTTPTCTQIAKEKWDILPITTSYLRLLHHLATGYGHVDHEQLFKLLGAHEQNNTYHIIKNSALYRHALNDYDSERVLSSIRAQSFCFSELEELITSFFKAQFDDTLSTWNSMLESAIPHPCLAHWICRECYSSNCSQYHQNASLQDSIDRFRLHSYHLHLTEEVGGISPRTVLCFSVNGSLDWTVDNVVEHMDCSFEVFIQLSGRQ